MPFHLLHTPWWTESRRDGSKNGTLGGQEKVMLYISYKETCPTFSNTVKSDDDQPIALITAPTGSVAFQIGGSTIHSAFLLHDNFKYKPSWEKRSQMQLK